MEQTENAQATQAQNTVPSSTGNNEEIAKVNARLEELERANKGLLRDLQSEREKRQQLEARPNPVPVGNPVGGPDPVADVLKPYVAPLEAEIQKLKDEREVGKALKFIAKQEKLDEDDVIQSAVFKDLVEVAKKHNLRGMSPLDEAKAAYQLLNAERQAKATAEKAAEAARNTSISSNSSVVSGQPVYNSGPRSFTRAEISAMSLDEYRAQKATIDAAYRAGLIK